MYLLLVLISTLILVHASLFLIGMAHFQSINRQVPSALAAGLLIASMVLVMMFGTWELLIISFVLYQSWTMLEGLLLQGRVSPSALSLAPVNAITIAVSLVSLFTGVWGIFAGAYLFHWSLTLFIGKRMIDKVS